MTVTPRLPPQHAEPIDEPVWGQAPVGGWGLPVPRTAGRPLATGAAPAAPRSPLAFLPGPRDPRPPLASAPRPNAAVPVPPWASPRPGRARPPLPRPPARRGRAPLAIAVSAVVALAAAVLAFLTPGYLVTRTFDDAALAQGVQRVLVEDYRLAASDVSCPAGVVVVAGTVFGCAATVNRRATTVPVRVMSRGGDYQVGRP